MNPLPCLKIFPTEYPSVFAFFRMAAAPVYFFSAAVEISTINAQATDIRVEITKPMALEDVKQILAWNLDIDHNGDRHFSGDELTPLAQDLLSKLETGREALRLYGLYNS